MDQRLSTLGPRADWPGLHGRGRRCALERGDRRGRHALWTRGQQLRRRPAMAASRQTRPGAIAKDIVAVRAEGQSGLAFAPGRPADRLAAARRVATVAATASRHDAPATGRGRGPGRVGSARRDPGPGHRDGAAASKAGFNGGGSPILKIGRAPGGVSPGWPATVCRPRSRPTAAFWLGPGPALWLIPRATVTAHRNPSAMALSRWKMPDDQVATPQGRWRLWLTHARPCDAA